MLSVKPPYLSSACRLHELLSFLRCDGQPFGRRHHRLAHLTPPGNQLRDPATTSPNPHGQKVTTMPVTGRPPHGINR